MTKEKINLGDVQETLLIPLYYRSLEAQRENPRIDASYDVDLVNKLDYDFSKFTGKLSMEGCVVRSIILDRETQKYINEHPSCIVLNFGCGLCTRTQRLDIKDSKWYNFDFPDTIELRNKLVKEKPNCYNISKSMLDETWPLEVNASADEDILVIVEGVFMYLTEADIKKFINIIQSNYKKVFALIEINPTIVVNNSKYHDSVKETSATFKWGIKYGKDLEKLDKGIKYLEEWNYFDYYENQGILFNIATKISLLKNLSYKIASYEFTAKSE
ncbi:polyketide synthesis O-methyltransferase [Anaeromyces robustus]|uniref:Polyketide synthesis O-methyltransferase n=1 Tax=Anaeromyces robustus TaxID=1754192 RepID=A0A1Y1VRS9_9FUNG|nr:polyketide synthesis O-methyltransferase [Anaeromyces robustus]|eukprot:ORX63474.1 polyketide synthesis O-methyltransferase [Anaeromyces robustus]